MKGPSLQKTAVFSVGLHMMFFLLSFLILRQSHEMVMPSPYTVSLVSPGSHRQKAKTESARAVEPAPKAPSAERKKTSDRSAEKSEQDLINESLAAIKAKKKLEKLARLKRALISIKGKGADAAVKTQAQTPTANPSAGAGEASYIDKVTGQIHAYWRWPGYAENNLEAIIAVRIQVDGTLSVVDFEKKSGNRLFDKLALRTIEEASPVAPPPYEMELGIRFYP